MIYRTYRADTYKEAVLKAKMELGNNIYIISRKEVKEGGVFGLFRKRQTEITVAKKEQPDEIGRKSPVIKKAPEQMPVVRDEQIIKELNEIKARLNSLTVKKEPASENDIFRPYEMMLRQNDFSDDYILNLKSAFEKEITLGDIKDQNTIKKKIIDYITGGLSFSGPIEAGKDRPGVVVLVGPTGVGKTTTIAKLAATFGVLKRHRVELVTIDSYRIAAIEQLGKYAELMQIPFNVINSREEFKEYLKGCSAELVFVDTAGRSQKNNMGLAELRSILDGARRKLDIHLVISATTKYRDAVDIFARFNQLMYEKVIISKLDETNTIGSIISALGKDRKLSYFTTGQSVPDDIELASTKKLIDMISFDDTILNRDEMAV